MAELLYRVRVLVELDETARPEGERMTDAERQALCTDLEDLADAVEDFARLRFRQWRAEGGGCEEVTEAQRARVRLRVD